VRRLFARFAAVGSLATAVDIGSFAALRRAGAPVVVADAAALALAGGASYRLHQEVTFGGDPYDRWLRQRREFVVSAVVAGAVDIGIVAVAAGDRGTRGSQLLARKAAAVAVAGTVRWVLHRQVLLTIVRSEHVPRAGRPPAPGDVRLSVVIPAYQESDRIGATVKTVLAALADLEGGVEVVVVDDGSDDGTGAAARAAGADKVVVHERNRGKGAAVRAGALAAAGRTIAFIDADLAYGPDQLRRLLDEVEHGWDVVVGSRQHEGTTTLVRARRLREVGGRAVNWLSYAVVLGRYRDTQCGLKAFRSDAARVLFERARVDGFGFDVELFAIAERNGLALTEVPVTVTNTTRSTVRVVRHTAQLVRDLARIRRWAREGAYQAGSVASVSHAGER
jgi:dolichyl-phosphate beta-glucosyltransferase